MSDNSNNTLMLILAYLGPLGLIPYLTEQDADVKWHAKQGLTLTGVWLLVSMTAGFLLVIPVIGWMLAIAIPFVSLALLAVVIVAMIKAINGERWRIPLIADLADKW